MTTKNAVIIIQDFVLGEYVMLKKRLYKTITSIDKQIAKANKDEKERLTKKKQIYENTIAKINMKITAIKKILDNTK